MTSSSLEGTTVGMIPLGCPKNLIDAEIMLGRLAEAGAAVSFEPASSDVLIINSCGFIDPAKEEAIRTILASHREREVSGRLRQQKIVVTGCLSQRYREDLPSLLPEVDLFLGLDEVDKIAEHVSHLLLRPEKSARRDAISPDSRFLPDFSSPRFPLTPSHLAYVKIAEGCNHPCTFCIIPRIRGRFRSRSIASIVHEVEELIARGVREVILISQDSTYFGRDRLRNEKTASSPTTDGTLADLLLALDRISGEFWIRVLYTHPAHWNDRLIEAFAAARKVVPYIDVPFQHISDAVLRRMQRGTSEAQLRELLAALRQGIPGAAVRTTFLVGFPGESEDDFQKLLQFVGEARFERLGVFSYSQEEGTRSAGLEGQVSAAEKKRRWQELMARQKEVVRSRAPESIGRKIRVLVDFPGLARSAADAPDVDGTVFVSPKLPPGSFADVVIQGTSDYDLIAREAGRARRA
ncbi:Ribosomal protein S12 methylthiotransferase RimO [Methylacidimicrobium cyclopophantes]|uniref:Ribosomal protein uS12 methylthiotransferase RimO n=1 Tax=Methylacidimicrobium cyclopophantes TaxID=1041766 RepID=A0A5E6M7F1_9BACT|nr:30S ribosomal protein S12 methylthiotransferase RimO [Methylacidimicrobium cyclopophantes]VVM05292.1 Ribosomal protein S12 methylthiotransferase RimO [Methylacidimicrobium cyclopophantes]